MILYIASIGIDYKDDEHIAYFYLPSSIEVGVNSSEENVSYIGKTSGKSILAVQQLGHSRVSTTSDIYGNAPLKEEKEMADMFAGVSKNDN